MHGVCITSDFVIGWRYANHLEGSAGDCSTRRRGLKSRDRSIAERDQLMSQQSVRQAARRSAPNAKAVFRKERADGNADSSASCVSRMALEKDASDERCWPRLA
jgi:hypothetical protein